MKKISILINKEKLDINFIYHPLNEYIYNYINYKLSPYKILGLFTYNTYPTDQYIIDGAINPPTLIEHIYQSASIINSSKSFTPFHIDNFDFFNTESGHFYLTTDECMKITLSPQNYCIIFSNIYH